MRCEQPKHSDGASDWERLEQFDEQTGLNPTPVRPSLSQVCAQYLRTNVGFQEKMAPSQSLKTIGMTINAP